MGRKVLKFTENKMIKLFYKNCILIHKESIHFEQTYFKVDASYLPHNMCLRNVSD